MRLYVLTAADRRNAKSAVVIGVPLVAFLTDQIVLSAGVAAGVSGGAAMAVSLGLVAWRAWSSNDGDARGGSVDV